MDNKVEQSIKSLMARENNGPQVICHLEPYLMAASDLIKAKIPASSSLTYLMDCGFGVLKSLIIKLDLCSNYS